MDSGRGYPNTMTGYHLIHHSNSSLMDGMQRIYGVGRVILCGDPSVLEPIDAQSVPHLYIIHTAECSQLYIDWVKRLVRHIETKYEDTRWVSPNPSDTLPSEGRDVRWVHWNPSDTLPPPSFIILIEPSLDMVRYTLRCRCPFVVITRSGVDVVGYMKSLNLSQCIITIGENTTYNQLKESFGDIYVSRRFLVPIIEESIQRERVMWTWAEKRVTYPIDKAPYTLRDTIYLDMALLIGVNPKTSPNGHASRDPALLIGAGTEWSMPHLYPWVGIVETNDLQSIQSMLQRPSFIISLYNCVVLFGYDDRSIVLLDSYLSLQPSPIRDIKTRVIPLLKHPSPPKHTPFHISSFMETPIAINIDSDRIYIYDVESNTITSSSKLPSTPYVIVSTQKHTFNGCIRDAIENKIPIILTKSSVSESILPSKYPLYVEDTSQEAIRSLILDTDEDTMESILYNSIMMLYDISTTLIPYTDLDGDIPL
jgi:hypothetical protein